MRVWYAFAKGYTDGNRSLRDLLGGKGANLAEMCNLGIPVPPGFTLPTTVCTAYYEDGQKLSSLIVRALDQGIRHIEKALEGPKFGDPERPLLVAVRSGARTSMPGMMDTVLNIGLTKTTVEGLAKWSGNRRFALDSYRRLIQMYGDVVCGVHRSILEAPLVERKAEKGYAHDTDLDEADLDLIIGKMLTIFEREHGSPFPQDPILQLRGAVEAVFGSWQTKRAITYRRINSIPDEWGTAANVQAMVFGNTGRGSGTGVAFSRNPSTGDKEVLGEWLPNAQGEDVVAGIRTPGLLHSRDGKQGAGIEPLEDAIPTAYKELMTVLKRLERHYTDIQDVEFTIQDGSLFLLQTRNAKRTAQAALHSAVAMVGEFLINEETALERVSADQINQLMHPQLDPEAEKVELAKGLPASPGAASGRIVLTPDRAEEWAKDGPVILVRAETSPEDIHGMHAAQGILTATGGMTSHAAVVARGMGRPCVAGCEALLIDEDTGKVTILRSTGDNIQLQEGDSITIDGALGAVYEGTVPTVKAKLGDDFDTVMQWADDIRRIKVRANADTPEDARIAVDLGAEGIGLCRTEHMFFAPDRISAMREMILADDKESRVAALKKLGPMQREDFEGIFKAMGERPVTIRLLDPPLHEFLPQTDEDVEALAKESGISPDQLRLKAAALHELNPMLGHRGCRLSLAYPEIVDMQARAILEAAVAVAKGGVAVSPEIMVPLVMEPLELKTLRAQIEMLAEQVFEEQGVCVAYTVGTMIELPRACLLADEIAEHAQFFSFGTNDLTQTTMGVSRDDAGRFLSEYVDRKIVSHDPFASLDRSGVGKLVQMATKLGRRTTRDLKVGVCGEHGGDPASIEFFADTGLDYVSCSPYRLPVARLAAAQAAIRNGKQ
ncbi:MAG: pyruvate, phosphate dikinase [Deltaproteobacteria bacterium]|nr:pyruvate, phosphate dikinase [Deltaproteobacteria bacterium]